MSFIVYIDEDSQKKEMVRLARDARLVVTFLNEQNTCGWSDEEQLIFATAREWILFSFNVIDFRRLHARWKLDLRTHSGIIVAEQSSVHFARKRWHLRRS